MALDAEVSSSSSSQSSGVTSATKLGNLKLTPQTFKMGTQEWQKEVSMSDRLFNIQKTVNTFYCTMNGAHHRRIHELMWFAREMEMIFYERADNKYLYDGGIDTMIETINSAIRNDKILTELRKSNDIPSTEILEKLFTFSAPRYEYDEEDETMADGADVVKLIPDDRFEHHEITIEPPATQPLLAEQKKRLFPSGLPTRKFVSARYTNRPKVEETSMTFTIEPCPQASKVE